MHGAGSEEWMHAGWARRRERYRQQVFEAVGYVRSLFGSTSSTSRARPAASTIMMYYCLDRTDKYTAVRNVRLTSVLVGHWKTLGVSTCELRSSLTPSTAPCLMVIGLFAFVRTEWLLEGLVSRSIPYRIPRPSSSPQVRPGPLPSTM